MNEIDVIDNRLKAIQQKKWKVLPYLRGLRDGTFERMKETAPDRLLYWHYRLLETNKGEG